MQLLRIGLFCVLALSSLGGAVAQLPAPTAPGARVVFVCEHGSVKSLIAASYFNQRAQAKGLSVRAVARGVAPELTVPPLVRTRLRADGFDVSGYRPQFLADSDIRGATLIVSFDKNVAGALAGAAR
jgi:protein-tyrosine-phosphatase